MSQKSHKVRVERSGATLGRRRVVNLLTQVRVYPRAGGARALPDVGRCSTWCRDPPSHVLHARRARRWRARVSRRRGGRPGGGTQRTVQFEPIVVHAEAAQRARVALLSVCGVSVGYQGGRNARIAFSEAAIEPPAGGFDACGARALPSHTATVEGSLYPF